MASDNDVRTPLATPPTGQKGDADSIGRRRTDESLLTERSKADSLFEEKTSPIEKAADAKVKLARERARRDLQTGRLEADRRLTETEGAATFSGSLQLQLQRDCEDAALKREQATTDFALQDERAMRRRYLADFLKVERGITDAALINERRNSDATVRGRDDMLATVCHELRTLAAGLAMNNALLQKDAPAGNTGDRVRKRATSGERLIAQMNRLINDLLDVSSLESGTISLEHENVDVAGLLLEFSEAYRPLVAARQITLTVEHPTEPICAWMDAGRVHQVLANLISNAIRFTPKGGEIVIRVERGDEQVKFRVCDDGVGIAPDELEVIFNRHRQVQQDRRGLGLGLHISRGIVEAHGGRIWAESDPGKGSRFHFFLPLAAATH
jgi:signal transduction histidine kinase